MRLCEGFVLTGNLKSSSRAKSKESETQADKIMGKSTVCIPASFLFAITVCLKILNN